MKHSLNKGKVREMYLGQFSGRQNGRKNRAKTTQISFIGVRKHYFANTV